MRAVYQVRHEMIVQTLGQDLADHLTIIPSVAGLHISATANTASPAEIRVSWSVPWPPGWPYNRSPVPRR